MRRTHAMKKLVTVLLAAAMVCTMGLTALAAGSPDTEAVEEAVKEQVAEQIKDSITADVTTTNTVTADESSKVVVNGEEVKDAKIVIDNINLETVSEEEITDKAVEAAAEVIANDENLKNDASNVKVDVWTVDVKVEGLDNVDKSNGVTVSFTVSGIGNSKDKVVIRHYVESTGVWETLYPDSVEGDVVTVTFTSFSPVVIVKVSEKEVEQPGTTETPTETQAPAETTQPTSPATADMPVNVVVLCAVAAFALAIVANKKTRNI
jgi:hypothetical protein